MKGNRVTTEQIGTAMQLEKTGEFSDAAAIYQKLLNSDPTNEPAISRLLLVYRKLKEYRKELSVLNDAIGAYQERQKAVQKNWIREHPEAAGAGKSMLRQLEKAGYSLTGLGENSVLARWIKRKELVTGKITGEKGKIPAKSKKVKKVAPRPQAKVLPLKQKEAAEKRRIREEDAATRKKEMQDRKEAEARRKKEQQEKKATEAARRKEEQEQKKAEVAQRKAEAARKKEESERAPSLFLILLRYRVDLEEIDAMMKLHVAYLKKHYDSGDFLVSGRQVPRIGGIILARAKDRKEMERKIRDDPFVKRKLASADVIEFTANQFSKVLEVWLGIKKKTAPKKWRRPFAKAAKPDK